MSYDKRRDGRVKQTGLPSLQVTFGEFEMLSSEGSEYSLKALRVNLQKALKVAKARGDEEEYSEGIETAEFIVCRLVNNPIGPEERVPQVVPILTEKQAIGLLSDAVTLAKRAETLVGEDIFLQLVLRQIDKIIVQVEVSDWV